MSKTSGWKYKRPSRCKVCKAAIVVFVYCFFLFEWLNKITIMWRASYCKKREWEGLALVLRADRRSLQWRTTPDILYIAADQRPARRQQLAEAVQASLQAPSHHIASQCITVLVLFIYMSGCVDVDGQLWCWINKTNKKATVTVRRHLPTWQIMVIMLQKSRINFTSIKLTSRRSRNVGLTQGLDSKAELQLEVKRLNPNFRQ